MDTTIQELLIGFGYDTHTARLVADQARKHGLSPADVAAWIEEARASHTIKNPHGFVRASITRGDKPPLRSSSRSAHQSRHRYASQFLCPDCQARPCICDWNPEAESLADFRERTTDRKGEPT